MSDVSLNNSFPHVGFVAYFPAVNWRQESKAKALANLLVDARWPWVPWWASFSGKTKQDAIKSKRVGGKNGSQPLVEGLLSDDLTKLYMDRAKGDGNFTSVSLDLDASKVDPRHETPYQLRITCRTADLPPGKTFEAFVALLDDLVTLLEARHAVVGAWPSFDWAIADSWTMRTVLDRAKGEVILSPGGKFQEQISLASSWKLFFGRTYARHPRWGNYLNDVHLEKIGGVERIAAEVAPAVVRRVGELTYVQLTASVETGMSAEAGAKRDKLEALMAPILPGAGAGSG